ncbi:MAG: two component transcriptional regulator, winged helix family [Acidimicrobiales bacterium]|nr:two component transcriptional regulator, winged helix family [Acidimicrobiales bacterium]
MIDRSDARDTAPSAETVPIMRLLIVDDDADVRRLLADRLSAQEICVTSVATGNAARAEMRHNTFDAAILDPMLADGSGLELMQVLRGLDPAMHVIVLSAAGTEDDRVRALELGADDYVVKPFSERELTARVLAAGRRLDAARDTSLRHGRVVVNVAARQVTVDQVAIDLTAKEFDLLAFLAARRGQIFSRVDLLRSVWQSDPDWQQTSTVTEHVRRLRAKIEENPGHPRLLRTVRGVGYSFDPLPPGQSDHEAGIAPDAPNVAASAAPLRDDHGELAAVVSVDGSATSPDGAPDAADIRRGLAHAELVVHYQPIVAFDDLHIVTLKATIRWKHPERGLLELGSFIDTAARSGLIPRLERFVLETACRQTAEWRRAGIDLTVAVNVSTEQLADDAFVTDVTEVLEVSGLDPNALVLEVVENALVDDLDQLDCVLERLAALGIGTRGGANGQGTLTGMPAPGTDVRVARVNRR